MAELGTFRARLTSSSMHLFLQRLVLVKTRHQQQSHKQKGFRYRKSRHWTPANSISFPTPFSISKCRWMYFDNVLPSQILVLRSMSPGVLRQALLTCSSWWSVNFLKQPGRAASTSPASPSCSKRHVLYLTAQDTSPSKEVNSRLVTSWVTNTIACSRWS